MTSASLPLQPARALRRLGTAVLRALVALSLVCRVPTSQALSGLERRVACATVSAILAAALSAVPAIASYAVIDRAVGARSVETVAFIMVISAILLMLNIAIGRVGAAYLLDSWRVVCGHLGSMAMGREARLDVQAIERAFTGGALWRTLGRISIPIHLAILFAIHPSLGLACLSLCGLMVAMRWSGIEVVARLLAALSGVVAVSTVAILLIGNLVTNGAIVAAGFAMAHVAASVYGLQEEWPILARARAAYVRVRRSPAAVRLVANPAHTERAEARGTQSVLVNAAAIGALAILLLAPMPTVVVLAGRAVAEGHVKPIKPAIPGRIATIMVADGDAVTAGQPVLMLDVTDVQARITEAQTQITLDDGALEVADRDLKTRGALLDGQIAALEPLVKKGLKPEADLIALKLRRADLVADNAIRAHALSTSISRSREKIAELQRQMLQSTLVAPAAGRIQGLLGLGRGSTVAPGDTAMTVVPEDLSVIEASIGPADREAFRVGQSVEVRVRTARGGYLPPAAGTVTSISPDYISDLKGYRAVVRVADPVRTGAEVEVIAVSPASSMGGWVVDVVTSIVRRAPR